MKNILVTIIFLVALMTDVLGQNKVIVFQTDFGLKDGAVAAMKGVALSVSPDLRMFDNTHEIPPYNIWEAAYRLNQTASYWPAGTVFVSVVDPGVGSNRRSIVMKARSGHYFVTPDNGTLTLVAEKLGVEEVRLIDESKNRLLNSQQSYTFHGRDVYSYTAARLASGVISFEEVGPVLQHALIEIPYQKAEMISEREIKGTVDILDVQYGNVWTNISDSLVNKLRIKAGDKVHVRIVEDGAVKFEGDVLFGNTFADVEQGKPVVYLNSLMNLSLGINQGNFAAQYGVSSGGGSKISIKRLSD